MDLRASRSRAKIMGTSKIPRLSVFRSNKYTNVQLIDDEGGKTLVAATSREIKKKFSKTAAAKEVGTLIGARAKDKGIVRVKFHRGPYRFHGRVKAVADGVREAGIKV